MTTGLGQWEARLQEFVEQLQASDPAHDLAHLKRVRSIAGNLAILEGAKMAVVVPAVWLHDCVMVPKGHPESNTASRLAAVKALGWLRTAKYPSEHHIDIVHAIEAHSFSAGIAPVSIEAKVVQDADRLDALGAIGVARCFAVAGQLGRTFYEINDPFAERRRLDDRSYALDHFYVKLLQLSATMQTVNGKVEAERRTAFMRSYLQQLGTELGADAGDLGRTV